MVYADHVKQTVWNSRYDWLRQTEKQEAGVWNSVLLSPQGTLIAYDLEIAFCAGAWISVIVLAHAAIDTIIRDTESGDYKINSQKIFGNDNDLQWLRKLRNRLVHVSEPGHEKALSEESLNDVAAFQESLETDARHAMSLVYRTIYENPGT